METRRLIFIFLGMGAVTYLPRLIPLAVLSQAALPDRLMRWLRYLPPAILSALILPGAVTSGGAMDLTPANPSVWALLLSFAVAVKTRSLILTMVVGGIVMYLGQVLLG